MTVQSVQQIVCEQKSPRLHVQLNCCRCGCLLVHQIVFYCKVKDTMSKKDPQLSPSTPWWCIWSSLESGVMGSVSRVKIVGWLPVLEGGSQPFWRGAPVAPSTLGPSKCTSHELSLRRLGHIIFRAKTLGFLAVKLFVQGVEVR